MKYAKHNKKNTINKLVEKKIESKTIKPPPNNNATPAESNVPSTTKNTKNMVAPGNIITFLMTLPMNSKICETMSSLGLTE